MPPKTELEELKEQADALIERLKPLEQVVVMTALQNALCEAIETEKLIAIFRAWIEANTFRSMI